MSYMKTVCIINSSHEYVSLFTEMGYHVISTNDLHNAELVVFTGGEDVTPAFYGSHPHKYTHSNLSRDVEERVIFHKAKKRGIPCVGICRGAQFLNVMSGGEMYQHVSDHCGTHSITDLQTGEVIYVSSTHHQMMKPSENGLLVASSALGGTREWYEGQVFHKDVSTEDIEVVYYDHTDSLCFQPHPEFAGASYEGMKVYFKGLLTRFFGE